MSALPLLPPSVRGGQTRLGRSVRSATSVRRAPRLAAAGPRGWDTTTAGTDGFDGFFEAFDESFRAFDQRMARVQRNVEAARRQADSRIDDAFSQVQHLQEDAGHSASIWGAVGPRASQESARSHRQQAPAEAWTFSGPNGSWSMHSHSSSSSFGSSYRYESFVSIHSGASPAYFPTHSHPARSATSPLLAVALLAAAAYAAVAALLVRGFHHTNFMHEERLRLSAAWPLLYGLSEKFRQQFAKAFSGLQRDFKGALAQHVRQSSQPASAQRADT